MRVVLWTLPLVRYSPAFAVQASLTLCLSPTGCCALSPFTTSDPVFHATHSPDHLLVLKMWMLTQCFSVSVSVVMNTEINNWNYLGALVREKTSCYKLFEVTVSLLTVVFSFFINGTKKAVFYHEDRSLPMPENCSVVHSWVGAQVLAY